jgi:hypothetical protein
MSELQTKLDELHYKVTNGPEGVNTLWERKLELWIKPRPSWCPEKLWAKLVNLVVHQVERV